MLSVIPGKFCDDISNGSGVIVLTDNRQTDRKGHPQTQLKTIPPSLGVW